MLGLAPVTSTDRRTVGDDDAFDGIQPAGAAMDRDARAGPAFLPLFTHGYMHGTVRIGTDRDAFPVSLLSFFFLTTLHASKAKRKVK